MIDKRIKPSVYGGTEAEKSGPAGFVEVAYGNKKYGKVKYNGTGTLVFGNWFLTAAHVVVDVSPDADKLLYASVSLGHVDRTQSPFKANAKQILYYPTYEPTYEGNLRDDLALLQLDPAIAKGVPSAKIGPRPKVGDTVYNLGWGAQALDQHGQPVKHPTRLRKGIYTVTESSPAMLTFEGKSGTTSIMEGDSGGPLFNLKGELVGVVSLRPKDPTNPTVVSGASGAIPIEFYKSWLEQVARAYA